MTRTLEDKISESENKHFQAGWQAALDFMKNREEKINKSVSGKEDVKLPEVGKKYRAYFDNMLEAEIEYISKNKEVVMSKLVNVGTKITVDENKIHSMDKFIKYFVELPEDNIEKLEIYHCKQCKEIIPNELAEGGAVTICSEDLYWYHNQQIADLMSDFPTH